MDYIPTQKPNHCTGSVCIVWASNFDHMATVKFYLRRPREKGKIKTTEVSIFLVLTIDKSTRFELTIPEKIQPVYWNFKRQEVKPNFTGHIEVNQHLSKIKNAILQLWRDNKEADINTLAEMARPLVKFGLARAPEKKTVFPVLWKFINHYRKEKDVKTAKKFEALYCERKGKDGAIEKQGHLYTFNKNLPLNRLDNNFYDEFRQYLFDQGHMDSTVYKYIANLSTFLTWADSRGHEIHYTKGKPTHKSWEIIKHTYEPITLTLAELEKLETLRIDEKLIAEKLPPQKHGHRGEKTLKALTTARDIFILECRTCQRISDLKRFNLADVVDGVWHNPVTKGNRLNPKKVRIPLNTKFTGPAWAILEKYKFQLPDFTEQKVNENIKTVCMLAGIDQHITQYRWKQNKRIEISGPKYKFVTTHVGRKTFITLALQFMQPKLVKDMAGISWNTLRHYEGQAEDQNLIDGLNSIPTTTKMNVA